MNEARFTLFFLYQYELHNLDVEHMTILADPRQEYRWLNLKVKPVNFEDYRNDREKTEDDMVNVEESLATLQIEEFPYKCDQCSSKYKKEGFLKRHKTSKHKTETGGMCGECEAIFPTAAELEKHTKRHNVCSICKAEFSSKSEADRHRSNHFRCQLCNYDYKTAFNLKRHMEGFHKS